MPRSKPWPRSWPLAIERTARRRRVEDVSGRCGRRVPAHIETPALLVSMVGVGGGPARSRSAWSLPRWSLDNASEFSKRDSQDEAFNRGLTGARARLSEIDTALQAAQLAAKRTGLRPGRSLAGLSTTRSRASEPTRSGRRSYARRHGDLSSCSSGPKVRRSRGG